MTKYRIIYSYPLNKWIVQHRMFFIWWDLPHFPHESEFTSREDAEFFILRLRHEHHRRQYHGGC